VRRDSDLKTLQDLNGKKWAYTDPTSTSGYIVPLIQLKAAGIEVAEGVATGGHPQAVLAVYNGEADFGTTFFNPPQTAVQGGPKWRVGDPVEPYANIADECALTADGKDIQCGDWLIKDARRNVRDTIPDAGQKLRILAISDPIPNDCMAFGPDFPLELRVKIELALMEFKETEDWMKSIGDFYTWQNIIPSTDADYEGIRSQIQAAGFSMDEVVGLLGE
jgi:phosphonate transport system substrate-binding protein